MGKSINGEDLGKGYYQKANGLYYAKKGVAGEEIYDSDMNLEQLKRRVNKRIKIIKRYTNGCICQAPAKSRCKRRISALVMPQPGHGSPVISTAGQIVIKNFLSNTK